MKKLIEALRKACADQGISLQDMTASNSDLKIVRLALEFATEYAFEFARRIDSCGRETDSIYDRETGERQEGY